MQGLPLAAGFALGAVVPPPDAVAATAVARRVAMPGRLIRILEGESLLNDATALVALRTAIAGAVSLWEVGLDFLIAALGGAAVGGVVGWGAAQLRRRLTDPALHTAWSFVVPFLAYLPAEAIHGSGVPAITQILSLVVVVLLATGIARHFDWSPAVSGDLGVALSFIPGVPSYQLDPELVLVGLIPPLLYSTAIRTSLVEIRANKMPIALLSVGLAAFTTIGVGLVSWLVPGLRPCRLLRLLARAARHETFPRHHPSSDPQLRGGGGLALVLRAPHRWLIVG